MRASWLNSGESLSVATLRAESVLYTTLSVRDYQGGLDDLKRTRGYVQQDEVCMHAGMPNFEALCAKFSPEHRHDDDEVRFVLEGEGIFDIRTAADRMMRVVVEAGDLIVVPACRDHRFLLTDSKMIRAARLFKDESGWVPRYRAATS
jgi:1,2-dihydroxy-3-keto-5-methylthiopentene dioxygenase